MSCILYFTFLWWWIRRRTISKFDVFNVVRLNKVLFLYHFHLLFPSQRSIKDGSKVSWMTADSILYDLYQALEHPMRQQIQRSYTMGVTWRPDSKTISASPTFWGQMPLLQNTGGNFMLFDFLICAVETASPGSGFERVNDLPVFKSSIEVVSNLYPWLFWMDCRWLQNKRYNEQERARVVREKWLLHWATVPQILAAHL